MSSVGLAVRSAALILLALVGCTSYQPFDHVRHRETYSLTQDELKATQFFLSTDVLVRRAAGESSASESSASTQSVVMAPRQTPGVVEEVGPHWLRVGFREGGKTVYFVADPTNRTGGLYHVGVQNEGEIRKIKDLRERSFEHDGESYTLVFGESAHLLVRTEDLMNIINSRSKVGGRLVPE